MQFAKCVMDFDPFVNELVEFTVDLGELVWQLMRDWQEWTIVALFFSKRFSITNARKNAVADFSCSKSLESAPDYQQLIASGDALIQPAGTLKVGS